MKRILVTVAVFLPALGAAQDFQEAPLLAPRTVAFPVTSQEALASQDARLMLAPTALGPFNGYAPLLDDRRLVVANSWARRAILSGPGVPGLSLSPDDCQESSVARLDLPCTGVPADDVDRVEYRWRLTNASGPLQIRFRDELNGPRRVPISVPFEPGNTLANPGTELRFVSGPPVPHQAATPWGSLANPPGPPTGEGTGFAIDRITLIPDPRPMPGAQKPRIRTYQRVSGVLLGGDWEDSFWFELSPSSNPQSVAIWFSTPNTDSVVAHASCGAKPKWNLFDIRGRSREEAANHPIFLDLTPGCPAGWNVVIGSRQYNDVVFHFTVGEHLADREWSALRVGTEFPTSGPAEDIAIRAALREGAWKFYGMTGGTQLIRSFDYFVGDGCNNVTVCWRNRPPGHCAEGSGHAWPGIGIGSLHICSTPGSNPPQDAAIIAHELGHVFAGLGDEYWRSHDFAKICGESDRLIKRCSHSAMSYTWMNELNSVCTERNHDAAPELFIQSAPTVWSRPFTVQGPFTLSECWNGELNIAGNHGDSGWAQMQNWGILPLPHPAAVTPVNYHYRDFARSFARTEIGFNIN